MDLLDAVVVGRRIGIERKKRLVMAVADGLNRRERILADIGVDNCGKAVRARRRVLAEHRHERKSANAHVVGKHLALEASGKRGEIFGEGAHDVLGLRILQWIDFCEMLFSSSEYEIDAAEDRKFMGRVETFRRLIVYNVRTKEY